MPLLHCHECHHEFEAVSKDDQCDWCGAPAYILKEHTEVEQLIKKMKVSKCACCGEIGTCIEGTCLNCFLELALQMEKEMGKTYRKSPYHKWQKEKKEYRREHYRQYRKATKQLKKFADVDEDVVFDKYTRTGGRLSHQEIV